MLLTLTMKCEYISLTLYTNEDIIPMGVPRFRVFWKVFPEMKKWAGRQVQLANRR